MVSFFFMHLRNASLIEKEMQLPLEPEGLCNSVLAKHTKREPLEKLLKAAGECLRLLSLPLLTGMMLGCWKTGSHLITMRKEISCWGGNDRRKLGLACIEFLVK